MRCCCPKMRGSCPWKRYKKKSDHFAMAIKLYKKNPFCKSKINQRHELRSQMLLCGKWMKSRSALSVPALTQNNISVLRGTDNWRGEEGWSFFFCSFIEFSPVSSNFLARKFNPCIAVAVTQDLHKDVCLVNFTHRC